MTEDQLRAAFARHEPLTPPVGPVRAAIDRLVVRRRRRRRTAAAAGAVLALLGAVGLAAPQLRPVPTGGTAAGPAAPAAALNVLLLGVDVADGARAPRADSVLIVHVPADRSRLYLISVPRDLPVAYPGGRIGKLNATFVAGGTDLRAGYAATHRAVTDLTGVRMDAGAVLSYPVLRTLTDALDGVPVCLPQRVRSVHTGRVFPAGCQRLDGRASVDLLRQRYGMTWGGFDRDRNAQRYAAGLLHRVDERGVLTDPALLAALLRELNRGGLVTQTGSATVPELLALASAAASADPVAVSVPAVFSADSSGVALDPAARSFFPALRDDRLADWTARNPKWVTELD
ncbi:LCP family protein [Micromonospora sp. NPDC050686]|uniref:LCP family protein n=1 Tax=Micromonospora sp. NPDC050686 TaxID=3154631 RepID=UPI0033FDB568